jgi:uncharacterized protein YcfJ
MERKMLNKFVKTSIKGLVPTVLLSVLAMPVMATDQYTDQGRVLSVTPQFEKINVPRQECRTEYQEQVSQRNNQSITGTVLGGIAGGLLGSTIGRGNGRVAAAAVGAGIGAIAGDRISNRDRNYQTVRTVPVQSCYQVDHWQTVETGYHVSYEYNGRQYSTVMAQRPGQFIDLNVSVAPNAQFMGNQNVTVIDYDHDRPYRKYNNRRFEEHNRAHRY